MIQSVYLTLSHATDLQALKTLREAKENSQPKVIANIQWGTTKIRTPTATLTPAEPDQVLFRFLIRTPFRPQSTEPFKITLLDTDSDTVLGEASLPAERFQARTPESWTHKLQLTPSGWLSMKLDMSRDITTCSSVQRLNEEQIAQSIPWADTLRRHTPQFSFESAGPFTAPHRHIRAVSDWERYRPAEQSFDAASEYSYQSSRVLGRRPDILTADYVPSLSSQRMVIRSSRGPSLEFATLAKQAAAQASPVSMPEGDPRRRSLHIRLSSVHGDLQESPTDLPQTSGARVPSSSRGPSSTGDFPHAPVDLTPTIAAINSMNLGALQKTNFKSVVITFHPTMLEDLSPKKTTWSIRDVPKGTDAAVVSEADDESRRHVVVTYPAITKSGTQLNRLVTMMFPVDFDKKDTMPCLWVEAGGQDPAASKEISLTLTNFLASGTFGIQGKVFNPDRSFGVTLSMRFTDVHIAEIMASGPHPATGILATVTTPARAMSSEAAIAPLPDSSKTHRSEMGEPRFDSVTLKVVEFEQSIKDLPLVMDGESTEDIFCRVGLGSSSALKSKLVNWRNRVKPLPDFQFDYRGEKLLRISLTGSKQNSTLLLGKCLLNLSVLTNLQKTNFKGKIPLNGPQGGVIGSISMELTFVKTGRPMKPWAAVSWSQACTQASLLSVSVNKICGSDLSTLINPFFVRLSCGRAKAKTKKLSLNDPSATELACDASLAMKLDETILSEADAKDFVLCLYVRSSSSAQGEEEGGGGTSHAAFQFCRIPASLFIMPSKVPRRATTQIRMTNAPDAPEGVTPLTLDLSIMIF